MPEQTTEEHALDDELSIDRERFDTVFSEVWDTDQDPDDRVHIVTDVETEVLRVVEDWVDQVHAHAAADRDGDPDSLYMVIEGAQATGKTTMTRYIKNQLDPLIHSERRDIPMILPIYDSTDPNQTPLKYRNLMQAEGRRVFEELDEFVPDIDDKIALLNSMSAEFSDERIREFGDAWGVPDEAVRGILGDAGYGGGDREPKEIVRELAQDGYVFLFVFDEMVSGSEQDKASVQSVLKWFKDHLGGYVGFVLFCHSPVSNAIRSEIHDQARRRNMDANLEIAGEQHDITEEVIINIRSKQDRIIDLPRLLEEYFAAVATDDDVDTYGPFTEANVQWMNSLLEAGGLIGNLIDGINPTVKQYAQARAAGDGEKKIGAYLFDECSRSMSHVGPSQLLEAHTELDPREDNSIVWRAKELITRSITVPDLEEDERAALEDARVLIPATDEDGLELNPSLVDYERVDLSTDDSSRTTSETPEPDFLTVYEETVRSYTEHQADSDDREQLRRTIEISVSTLLEYLNSRQVNTANSGTLTLPGQEEEARDYMEIGGAGTMGGANKLQITDGEYAEYGYSFLTYTLFDDESLNDPETQDVITDHYSGENGIIILTDRDPDSIDRPDWFRDEIDRQHWDESAFTWDDIVQIVHLDSLRDILGVYRHLQDRDIEEDSQALTEIDRLDGFPTTPGLNDQLDRLHRDMVASIRTIHDNIYSKYDGPTLPEAEAFAALVEAVQAKGFISQQDLEPYREDYGFAIASLTDKGALVTVGDDPQVVFLQEDFGHVSKLQERNVSGKSDLFPVAPAIFERLERFQEMEQNRVRHDDDEITDVLDELENKIELIDFFRFDENRLQDIETAIDDTDVEVFGDVRDAIEAARDTAEEDAEAVKTTFNADQELWEEISELEVDTDISPIHRALFFAKLNEEPPRGVEDYLDTAEDYPDLLFDLYRDIEAVLEELDTTRESVEDGFTRESEELNDVAEGLSAFLGLEFDNDEAELDNGDVSDLQDLSLEDLRDVDFESRISSVARDEEKRENLTQAIRLLGQVENAVDNHLKEGLGIDAIDDIEAEVAQAYIPVGREIVRRLFEDDILFADTDQPEIMVRESKQFCEQLAQLVEQSQEKERIEDDLTEHREQVADVHGETLGEKITFLERKAEDLQEAQRLLQLQSGHCDLCQTEWESLTTERQEEIDDRITEIEDEYGEALSLEELDDLIDTTQDRSDSVEEVQRQINELEDELADIDLRGPSDALDDLKEKYEPAD